ncbi:hypothetical protein Nepgr_031501 [Nepenthes gracilis]|uniref:Uncharacterized protein n=1 Tax=Nepenthes gracilis TaxID=150966 RepID=A0AAD3TGU4_NEPGR|nr:hypothetical protein Nepgr_031501 [Nepenthes gracilis]
MYQARSLRAAIEFFWIGGQQLNIPLYVDLKLNNELLSGFSEEELLPWGINILWSLNQFERCDKHLVVWDVMAASMAFKQFAPRFIYHILSWWLPNLLNISSDGSRSLSNVASRKLHLINIICRRVFLSGTEVDKPDEPKSESSEEEKLWMQLLMRNERELRERLVGFSLSSALCVDDNSATGLRGNGCQDLVGIPQMVQWVRFDRDCVRRELDLLGSEVGRLTTRYVSSKKRLQGLYKCETEEQCSYCSAPVQFESPEFAICRGQRPNVGGSRDHKLLRCSVSMRVCPVTPTWFCVCCRRRASKLAPHQLYMMPGFPVDFMPLVRSENGNLCRKPLCPLCGILMQRSLPAFLLSPSPV